MKYECSAVEFHFNSCMRLKARSGNYESFSPPPPLPPLH